MTRLAANAQAVELVEYGLRREAFGLRLTAHLKNID